MRPTPWKRAQRAAWMTLLATSSTWAQTPWIDVDFDERSELSDVDVVIVREKAYGAAGVDLTDYGLGVETYVQSIYVRQFAPSGAKKASAGRIVLPPEVTILGILTSGGDLKKTDAVFGVGPLADYPAFARGFESSGEEFVCATTSSSMVFGLSTDQGVDDFRILIDYGDSFPPDLSFDVSSYGVPELFGTPLSGGFLVGDEVGGMPLGAGDYGEVASVLDVPLTSTQAASTQDCSLLAQPGRSVYILRKSGGTKSLDAFDVDNRTPVPGLSSVSGSQNLDGPVGMTAGPDDRLYALGDQGSYATIDPGSGFLSTDDLENRPGLNIDLTGMPGTRMLWFVRRQSGKRFVDALDVDTLALWPEVELNELASIPAGIADGSDGLLWILGKKGDLVGLDPITGFELPAEQSAGTGTYEDLTGHPSRSELFLLRDAGSTALIDVFDLTSGQFTYGFASLPVSDAIGITDGPDGHLYVVGRGQGSATSAFAAIAADTGLVLDFNTCMDFAGGAVDIAFTDAPPQGLYCSAKINSQGCLPSIDANGTPSFSAPSPFTIGASDVINQKAGMLAYGLASATLPFAGGTLCVQPYFRTVPQSSGGTPGAADCSGTLSLDFNPILKSNANLAACMSVFCQWFYRDPADPTGIGLTDALQFDPQP